MTDQKFEELLQTAESQRLVGWDFSWLNARTREEPLPWDYREIVKERSQRAAALLDVDTGGGEFLASLAPFPPLTWASEGYPPNVLLARARLEPLGARLIDVSNQSDGRLPIADDTFALVTNRHGAIRPDELRRVLLPGGRYVTQQVGGQNCLEMNYCLEGTPTFPYASFTLAGYLRDLEQAGMQILAAREAFPAWTFLDIAGVVFYLNAVSWQIPGFTVERYRDGLYRIHHSIEEEGGWTIREHRFLVEARKPAP